MDLSRYLPYKRLFFGENAMECRGTRGRRFAAQVSIKEYGAQTAPGMLDGFFHLPFEFVLTQSFVFSHRQEALSRMQVQQRRMQQAGDLAVSQTEEIDEALDDAMAGAIAFGQHHLTIQPIVGSLNELEDAVARIETELMNVGILGVREDLNMEACFWAQLPGNFEYIARRSHDPYRQRRRLCFAAQLSFGPARGATIGVPRSPSWKLKPELLIFSISMLETWDTPS